MEKKPLANWKFSKVGVLDLVEKEECLVLG